MSTPSCVFVCLGKKLLGRSQVRSVAEKRRDKLNDYCKVCTQCTLLSLDIFTVHHIRIPELSLMNCTTCTCTIFDALLSILNLSLNAYMWYTSV